MGYVQAKKAVQDNLACGLLIGQECITQYLGISSGCVKKTFCRCNLPRYGRMLREYFILGGKMGMIMDVETILAYKFSQPDLLQMALTHSSWANENGSLNHNERQEFLGDAVLELCVSWELFTRFPGAREGDMTRLRSRLVSTTALAALARDLGLEQCLMLGKGEESQGGRHRDTLLSDALEAVLGAVFEDGGFVAARQVVQHIFRERWPTTLEHNPHKDFKTRLQEVVQCVYKDRPVYTLLETRGPEHAKEFLVRLDLPGGQVFSASGPSLKRAEQEAARSALQECQPMLPEPSGADSGPGETTPPGPPVFGLPQPIMR